MHLMVTILLACLLTPRFMTPRFLWITQILCWNNLWTVVLVTEKNKSILWRSLLLRRQQVSFCSFTTLQKQQQPKGPALLSKYPNRHLLSKWLMEKKCSPAHIPNAQMSIVGEAQMQKNIGLDMWTRAISMIAATVQNHLARHQIVFATKDNFMNLQSRSNNFCRKALIFQF